MVLFHCPCIDLRYALPSIVEHALLCRRCMDICLVFRKYSDASAVGYFPQERWGDRIIHFSLRRLLIDLSDHAIRVLDIQFQRTKREYLFIFVSCWIRWLFRTDRLSDLNRAHWRLPVFLYFLHQERNTFDTAIIRYLINFGQFHNIKEALS